jgi:hypothetical protein
MTVGRKVAGNVPPPRPHAWISGLDSRTLSWDTLSAADGPITFGVNDSSVRVGEVSGVLAADTFFIDTIQATMIPCIVPVGEEWTVRSASIDYHPGPNYAVSVSDGAVVDGTAGLGAWLFLQQKSVHQANATQGDGDWFALSNPKTTAVAWNDSTEYSVGDNVIDGNTGLGYTALADNSDTGPPPDYPATWKGPLWTGAYNNNAVYGHSVKSGSDVAAITSPGGDGTGAGNRYSTSEPTWGYGHAIDYQWGPTFAGDSCDIRIFIDEVDRK